MAALTVVVVLISFSAAFAAIRVVLSRFGNLALDRPNERSLHDGHVPRTGGIAVLLGAAVPFAFGAEAVWLPFMLAWALAAVSLVDDFRSLPAWTRLLAHGAAATILVWYALSPMNPVELALLIVAVVWVTNLFNFMDGSDGLAGGMALIGFGTYAAGAYLAGDLALALACTGVAAAVGAFLLHNFHPARIFLGDVGSIPLGFLAGALGLVGWRDDAWPLAFVPIVFAAFIGDATLTLARRLFRGERVWRAHREHYYQRMVRMGFGHRRTAWSAYILMFACACIALYIRTRPGATQAAASAGVVLLLGALALWVDVRWSQYLRAGGAPT